MAETMTQTFNSLNTTSKRMFRKQKDINSDISSVYSNKNPVYSSTTNNNDWHRLLLARLKPGVTGKYRTTRKDGNTSDKFSTTSFDVSNVTLQSYSDDSVIIDNRQTIITQSDSSREYSMRKDNHFIKNSISNRSGDHMTSLKRRVRKQQMRHFQNQPTILQETTFQPPAPSDLFSMPYPEQAVSPRRYRPKQSSCVVPLPSLMKTTRMIPTHMHGIQLSLYGY